MPNWTFYPVFIATIVSVIGLGHIALRHHNMASPKSLSELAVAESALLQRFRSILIFCGLLFAVTVFGFIMPRVQYALVVGIFGACMVGGELLAAIIPARGKTLPFHAILAQVMAVGMLGLGALFTLALPGLFAVLSAILTATMATSALFTLADKQRYILYELLFIFSSHLSVVVAAFALR